jgi:hypothetical protein
MQIVMAGFDKVDPAIDVFCVVRDGSRMTVEWASSPIREFRRVRWTREWQWSEKTPCTDESARRAGYAC